MKQHIKVNGVLIKDPDTFSVQKYNITKSGRLASGKMTMDLVAKKRKLILHWFAMSGTQLNQILNLVDTDKMFFDVEYVENNQVKHVTAYNGDINQELFRTDGPWWWKDVEFHFIEQ